MSRTYRRRGEHHEYCRVLLEWVFESGHFRSFLKAPQQREMGLVVTPKAG
jgi:hypothetical protein